MASGAIDQTEEPFRSRIRLTVPVTSIERGEPGKLPQFSPTFKEKYFPGVGTPEVTPGTPRAPTTAKQRLCAQIQLPALSAFPAMTALLPASHLPGHRNKPHRQHRLPLDDVPMLLQEIKSLIPGFANWNDHAATVAQLLD